jgi:hypothetical protein
MVGTKSINWTLENERKMLHALLYHGKISVSTEVAEKVAKYLGEWPLV